MHLDRLTHEVGSRLPGRVAYASTSLIRSVLGALAHGGNFSIRSTTTQIQPMKTQRLFCVGFSSAILLVGALGGFAQTLTVTNDLQLWLRADAGVTTNASGGVTQWA